MVGELDPFVSHTLQEEFLCASESLHHSAFVDIQTVASCNFYMCHFEELLSIHFFSIHGL